MLDSTLKQLHRKITYAAAQLSLKQLHRKTNLQRVPYDKIS